MTDRIEELLVAYEVGVEDPEISGMEHLDMLLTRSELAKMTTRLNRGQSTRLQQADAQLAQHADAFYRAISQVADLQSWREQEHAPTDQWWWYLDVLVAAPVRMAA